MIGISWNYGRLGGRRATRSNPDRPRVEVALPERRHRDNYDHRCADSGSGRQISLGSTSVKTNTLFRNLRRDGRSRMKMERQEKNGENQANTEPARRRDRLQPSQFSNHHLLDNPAFTALSNRRMVWHPRDRHAESAAVVGDSASNG